MSLASILGLAQTALELGLISSLTVLALFLSYSMLNVCDLSTDGCFTLGAAVGAVVAISGHPYLAIPAAMGAGILSGFITALLQTKMGVDSLLAGIIVNTGLYSVNIAVMGNASLLNMNKTETVFTKMKQLLQGSCFFVQSWAWRSGPPEIIRIWFALLPLTQCLLRSSVSVLPIPLPHYPAVCWHSRRSRSTSISVLGW